MIWIQPPGTATMGHLFLDAYHATGDEYYYRAAEAVAGALIRAQHPSGGWNYLADFAGERSLREWYDTVGRNAWRMEEFQHYWGNATFDDCRHGGVGEVPAAALRREAGPEVQAGARQGASAFVLDSQYPIGAWPQRFPLKHEFSHHGKPGLHVVPDLQRRRGGREHRLPGAVLSGARRRARARCRSPAGMNAFLVTQHGPAAARLGAAVHARPAAGSARAPTSPRRWRRTPPPPTSSS